MVSASASESTSTPAFRAPSDILTLTEYEAGQVTSAALTLWGRHHHRDLNDDTLLHDIELASGQLPSRLQSKLRRFRDAGNREGVLLIGGLNIETTVPTPCGRKDDPRWSEVPISTLSQVMIMSATGAVISYHDEKGGRLVQDVYPKSGQECRQENSGSVLLELHTEDGFLATPPDFLSLLCLRSDHDQQAATVACGIRQVLPSLSDEQLRLLYEPRFAILFSSSFTGDGAHERWSAPMPVLSGPREDPEIVIDLHGMRGLDGDAAAVLAVLRDIFVQNLVGAVLGPGQMIIVDNRTAVHGRTSFWPRYDNEDRWLRRCFSISDLRKVRAARTGSGRALSSGDAPVNR